jgi:hypothetical protein
MAAKVRPAKAMVKSLAAKREALGGLELRNYWLKRHA